MEGFRCMNINGNNKETMTFVELLLPNQRRIQAFILTLVPNINDAEDIYQETVSEMWSKFDSFHIGTDFVAWAATIAKYKVLTYISKKGRSKVHFNSQMIGMLESHAMSKMNSVQKHFDILEKCLKKLGDKEQFLLKLRYESDLTFQKISDRTGKTASAIHQLMAKIHTKLALCIRRTLHLEEIA